MQLGGILRMHGSCSMMRNEFRAKPPWRATFYDATCCRVMTIVVCNMQSEDSTSQVIVWKNLNTVMACHDVPNRTLKGSWRIAPQQIGTWFTSYMVVQMHLCLWRTRREHASSIGPNPSRSILRPAFGVTSKTNINSSTSNTKNATTIIEAETCYLVIRPWWLSSSATSEDGFSRLDLWLAFWYFWYRQWVGFMHLVHSTNQIPTTSLFSFFSFSLHIQNVLY